MLKIEKYVNISLVKFTEKEKKDMDYKRYISEKLKIEGMSAEEIYGLIALPPTSDMGDYALPCFKLAKILRKSPVAIAENLKENFPIDEVISEVSAVNGYLNFKVDKTSLTRQVLDRIFSEGDASAPRRKERERRFVSIIRPSISPSPFISVIFPRPYWAGRSIVFSIFSAIRR